MKPLLAFLLLFSGIALAQTPDLTLARDKNWLVIQGPHLPGGEIRINYLEAYCRENSTTADWHDTTIGHTTELLSLSEDKKTMKLRCTVKDGVIVDHTITASTDDVTFAITAHNPTATASGAHWAQPCIRLGDFTGYDNKGKDIDDYLPKCFLFLDGKLTRMSDIKPWIKEARYIPGQVWCPGQVPRTDVNPRPLSPLVPSNGLIGCFSGDETQLFAVAFNPYQELFQGVARCLHSDFRIGGLKPGETKHIKGNIYILPNDVPALLTRYAKDFPGQQLATAGAQRRIETPPVPAASRVIVPRSKESARNGEASWTGLKDGSQPLKGGADQKSGGKDVWQTQPLRILPLGDSITRGSYLAQKDGKATGLPHPLSGGWRKALQDKLHTAGIAFDFVGELSYAAFGRDGAVDPKFDPDHHGLAGFGNTGILKGGIVPTPPDVLASLGVNEIKVPGIVEVLKKHQPDIILLMSGANGFDAPARDRLIRTIGEHSTAQLFVATILPQKAPRAGWEHVDAYNASLPAIVAAQKTADKRITLVDMHDAITTDDLSPDGVHPNQAGMEKMAAIWFSAISASTAKNH